MLILSIFIIFNLDAFSQIKKPSPTNHPNISKKPPLPPLKKNNVIYPDEFSDIDNSTQEKSIKDDENLSQVLRRARIEYAKALGYVERNDTLKAEKFFKEALDVLNKLVSYPNIENNNDFTTLAQNIIYDYEKFVGPSKDLDDNSSFIVMRDLLLQEVEIITTPAEPVDAQAVKGLKTQEQTNKFLLTNTPIDVTIPLIDNEFVQNGITFLTQNEKGRRFLTRCLERSTRWFPMMKRYAVQEGVPEEIIYLSMIESALNPNAFSKAKAVGLWQFIRTTGEMYNLNSNESVWIDERRDPEKSTIASMRHLRDLFNEFGDWHLALAAYNCGAGGVKRAIRRSNLEKPNFWQIRPFLPKETRNYVPLYIATAKVAMQPEAYGFLLDTIVFQDEFKYEVITLNEPVSISALAQCAGVSEEELRNLNPELLKSTTPPDVREYALRIPYGSFSRFAIEFVKLTQEEKQPWVHHTVGSRETLASIATQYDISINELMSANSIKTAKHKLRSGEVLQIPVDKKTIEAKIPDESSIKRIEHIVKENETLYSICLSYGVELSDLRRLNDIPSSTNHIQEGTKIIIPVIEIPQQTATANTKEVPKVVRHKVRKGETLARIADNYCVSMESIKQDNKLRSYNIMSGQVLKIQTDSRQASSQTAAAAPTTQRTSIAHSTPSGNKVIHKVRAGETLTTVASRYGVKTSDLKKWNSDKISGNTVFSGSRLVIYTSQISKGSSSTGGTTKYYTVRKGDTLSSIASKFGVTVNSLQRNNKNLSERYLKIGQRLKIQ